MLLYVLAGAAVLIAVLVIVVATRPAAFHIERSITVVAKPAAVFAEVNDFRTWAAWSPWEKLDPQMKRAFTGPSAGKGAAYAWVGNKKVGEGRMTIERSDEPSRVQIKLEFIKPWTATNVTTFSFAPLPDGTMVTWAMDGRNGFMAKAASMCMNMDKMVGGDFERGLSAMKAAVEARPT
jgi:hypothetical protein